MLRLSGLHRRLPQSIHPCSTTVAYHSMGQQACIPHAIHSPASASVPPQSTPRAAGQVWQAQAAADQSSGMGSTAWCRRAKLLVCLERPVAPEAGRLCMDLLRWHSRRKSASMCVSLTTISWKLGLPHTHASNVRPLDPAGVMATAVSALKAACAPMQASPRLDLPHTGASMQVARPEASAPITFHAGKSPGGSYLLNCCHPEHDARLRTHACMDRQHASRPWSSRQSRF